MASSVRGSDLLEDSGALPAGVPSATQGAAFSAPLGPAVRPRSGARTALGIAIIAIFALAVMIALFAR